MSTKIVENTIEKATQSGGDNYNQMNVILWKENNGSMTLSFNPIQVKEENGMRVMSFAMFSNGYKSLRTGRQVGRLTAKQKLMAYDIVKSEDISQLYDDLKDNKPIMLSNYPDLTKALNQFKPC